MPTNPYCPQISEERYCPVKTDACAPISSDFPKCVLVSSAVNAFAALMVTHNTLVTSEAMLVELQPAATARLIERVERDLLVFE